MNEWGIPDWRRESNYGDTTEWSMKRWQWEFYRRQNFIREYFDERADKAYQQNLETYAAIPELYENHSPLPPSERGFTLNVDYGDELKIGYYRLANPRIGNQPEMTISPCTSAARLKYDSPTGCSRGTIDENLTYANIVLTKRERWLLGPLLEDFPVRLRTNQVAVTFDFDFPLEPQIKTAKEFLKSEYERLGRPSQKRAHKSKWLSYLRTIDAREAGASWSEIAEIHNLTAQREQTARDIWEAATRLRFNF